MSRPDSRISRLDAAAVGARDTRPSGSPLVAGSTVPGFVVDEALASQLLRLVGRHRFSTYSPSFLLEERAAARSSRPGPTRRFPARSACSTARW